MKDYFYMLAAASVLCSLYVFLAGKGFEKYLRYISALVIICLAVAPLKKVFTGVSVNLPEISAAEGSIEEIYEEAIKNHIADSIEAEFGIKPEYVGIYIDRGEEFYTVTSITIKLFPEDADKVGGVKGYIEEKFGGEVEVTDNRETAREDQKNHG